MTIIPEAASILRDAGAVALAPSEAPAERPSRWAGSDRRPQLMRTSIIANKRYEPCA